MYLLGSILGAEKKQYKYYSFNIIPDVNDATTWYIIPTTHDDRGAREMVPGIAQQTRLRVV